MFERSMPQSTLHHCLEVDQGPFATATHVKISGTVKIFHAFCGVNLLVRKKTKKKNRFQVLKLLVGTGINRDRNFKLAWAVIGKFWPEPRYETNFIGTGTSQW